MSDKHPHAELMRRYLADQTQEWRQRSPFDTLWSMWIKSEDEPPAFDPNFEYEFRPCAAKRPKRMRYPGGMLTFAIIPLAYVDGVLYA